MRNEVLEGDVWGGLRGRAASVREEHPGIADGDLIDLVTAQIVDSLDRAEVGHVMTGDDPLIRGTIAMAKLYNDGAIVAGQIDRLGLPGVRFSDGPRGVVIGNATAFPVPMARAATFNPELEARVGDAIGVEAVASGANLFAGVCINVLRNPRWGRAQETYGEDSLLLGRFGAAVVRGAQRHLMTCVKHFAANSVENSRWVIDVHIDDRDLTDLYLPHFKACVDAGADCVMSAYNKVNGVWAGENPWLLTEVLKDRWDFDGFVMTDFLFGVRDGRAALRAGQDMEMPFAWRMRKVSEWMSEDDSDDVRARESARRIVRSQVRGALRSEDAAAVESYASTRIACDEHRQLALEVARQAIVLLRNESLAMTGASAAKARDANLERASGSQTMTSPRRSLPIDPAVDRIISICGSLAREDNTGDRGSSWVHALEVSTIASGINSAATGAGMSVRDLTLAAAKDLGALVRGSDCAVVVVGLGHDDEGEFLGFRGGDRATLELPSADVELIRTVTSACANTIVVVVGGAPVIVDDWIDSVQGLLMAWYPGQMGGQAVADVLFGQVEPSGRLPCTWPRSEAQLPPFKRWTRKIEYGPFHGYRHFIQAGLQPQFWFGFGLGYVDATWEQPVADQHPDGGFTLSVPLTNPSSHDAVEVVQLYVDQRLGSALEPVATMVDFARVVVPSGGSAVATFECGAEQLQTWRDRAEGELVLSVGPSADPAVRWIARQPL
ncbi:MAG: glycoside hydrolase family 3 C-terminal domain-containing protein [Acidimicrobiia bacterium]|nr:glycoside hydrolase family 3 C-terminal domain-containing protein [Acidimicrobiia bacterium]MBP8180397.1 glycoside hydrolase family 3 C-terminal domain-containing protein [Acidimicrobiia bacterium]